MSKRDRHEDQDERPAKRARQEHARPQPEEVHYARQLQDFLIFRQDGIQQLRNGIASFKIFLESILYHKEEDNRGRQVSILREYLESQKPQDPKDLERPFLSQLWQAWSFASQNNNDHLASSVSAILALLIKTLSGILDLREHGFLLCRTVLQHQHLRLVKRSLDAPKHKEYVISPSLRLLTEVTSFDGGALARQVYKHREQTFDVNTIRRCLSLIKTDVTADEARRKPAIRSLTLRYVSAHLKYLHEGGKIDVLKNRPLCNAVFQHIGDDPVELVNEVLTTIEQSILKDPALPRSSKATLLTPASLEKITQIAAQAAEDHGAADVAFAWLKAICTKSDYGILRHSGFYPPGTPQVQSKLPDDTMNLDLDDIDEYDRPGPIDVRNPVLLAWTKTMHAHANPRERELLLTCFTSAPELVAAYFSEKTLQMDPKLSNTWLSYASLLFDVVKLPVPPGFGADESAPQMPPPPSVLIENILPRPLTQVVLSRCLNQSSELITLFAARILVLALQKLSVVIDKMQSFVTLSSERVWKEAIGRLRQRCADRCPLMKDIIATFRKLSNDGDHALQRETILKLLSLYYEVMPQLAFGETFDISGALTTALARSASTTTDVDETLDGLGNLELKHLLTIARDSTGMKWFSKQGGLTYSPITTLLQIHRKNFKNRQFRMLLEQVLVEHNVIQSKPKTVQETDRNSAATSGPVTALVASVMILQDMSSAWDYIDDCFGRAARKPVKYIDDLEQLAKDTDLTSRDGAAYPSVLAAVLREQASFIAAEDQEARDEKSAWAQYFLALLCRASDDGRVLEKLQHETQQILPSKVSLGQSDLTALLEEAEIDATEESGAAENEAAEASQGGFELKYQAPAEEPQSRPELTRWSQKDLDVAIDDGDVGALILCLCSEHNDVRRQAMVQIGRLKANLHAAQNQENGGQMTLLVGELLETFEQHFMEADHALPYLAGTFAVKALDVLVQPHHFMYSKVNRFLIRGPEWRVQKLPNYWLSNTVLSMPEDDDAYWREVQWVLDWLVDGLRTVEDLNILRRSSVLERVLALWHSPGAAVHKHIRDRVYEMLHRATCVAGGNEGLITRTGILSWLAVVEEADPKMSAAFLDKIVHNCDADRLKAWTGLSNAA